MGNMKVWTLLVVAIWVCWLSILVVSAPDRPLIEEEEDTLLGFAAITFDTPHATKGSYTKFMRDLRDKLKGSVQKPDGIPVTSHSLGEDSQERYVLVKIGPKSQRVTLAIDVVDLYVLGYRDVYNNKNRYRFFKGVSSTAQSILSIGADLLPIPFGGSYKDLEGEAGNRDGIELGIGKLENEIQSVFGLAPTAKDRDKKVAKFLIIAIQMVAEGARFKCIEEKVLSSIKGQKNYESFKPDKCMQHLETNWDQLSKTALRNDRGGFEKKIKALECKAEANNLITKYMGILKYSSSGVAKTEDYISFLKFYDTVSTD